MSLENQEIANEAVEVAMRYLVLPVVVGSLVAVKRDEKQLTIPLSIYALL